MVVIVVVAIHGTGKVVVLVDSQRIVLLDAQLVQGTDAAGIGLLLLLLFLLLPQAPLFFVRTPGRTPKGRKVVGPGQKLARGPDRLRVQLRAHVPRALALRRILEESRDQAVLVGLGPAAEGRVERVLLRVLVVAVAVAVAVTVGHARGGSNSGDLNVRGPHPIEGKGELGKVPLHWEWFEARIVRRCGGVGESLAGDAGDALVFVFGFGFVPSFPEAIDLGDHARGVDPLIGPGTALHDDAGVGIDVAVQLGKVVLEDSLYRSDKSRREFAVVVVFDVSAAASALASPDFLLLRSLVCGAPSGKLGTVKADAQNRAGQCWR
mmetsp:Transcript_6123/g.15195  ORF Transcript_6123/g.15195 Transcript_6123/m.15195 type:complete len:322 (-) Transcript_6123:1174-2139(-)